ncbi:hypothetical protein cyc_01415 [Cyclospora cayetanensis]|uniref:Uncharacterized protein n=1 Tax=Cyclospora cayetanensis TaxID=88456 RepID=A0A1D3D8P2_9EIME|nr:hypothetical protein cyc_01415 [Cyclospora cayetanensis]
MLGNGTSLGRQRSESSSAGNDSTSNSRPCISHTGTPPSMTRPSAGSIPKSGADISSTWKNSPTGSSGSRISHPRSSSSRNKNGADARRGSSNRSTACGDGGNDDTFVSEALLREIVFEDYSRASSWERLQHQLLSSVRSLKIAVARHRFLRQVDAANAEAAVPPVASAPHQPMRAGDALINKSGSWHTCAEILPRCACACSSLAQEQQQSSLSMQLFAPLVLQTLLINPQHQTHPLGTSQRLPGELLRLTYTCSAPLPEVRRCSCTVSRRSGDVQHALQDTDQFFEEHGFLSSSAISSLLRGGSGGHRELRCGRCAACILQWERLFPSRATFLQRDFGEETADISGAAPSTEAAGNAVRTERCEGSIAAKATDISPLLIREYASHCLSSSFAFGDWTEANPHQGHPTICALQRLAVTAQYTYFLPRQWQHTSWRKLQNCTSAAAVKAPHEAWWLQSAPGNAYGDSEGTSSRKSASLIDAWREIGVGAATPPEDTEGSTTPTADMLLQLLLQQPCLTAATVATCQAEATQGTTEEGQKWSAFAAARGISCCPDGPCALPDLCCTPLQQLFQQLNCAIQQRRLQSDAPQDTPACPCTVRSAEQLVLQGEYLLRQREATRSAAAAALAGATHPLGAVQRAAMAAAHLVTTEGPPDSQRTDPKRMHLEAEAAQQQPLFNYLVEGEMALHGLESLTAPDLLGHLLRILVASLSEQCRLACACVLAAAPFCDGGIRRCLYTPGVAAVCFERSGRGVHATNSTSTSCRGALFPCHIPALQAAVDDLQRHAIAHAATIPAAAFKDGSSWIPSVALLAACLRCLEGWQAGECPDAECDILVPILSCSEKRALQHVLHRCSGDLDCDSAMGTSDDPWDVRLPWPPFAEEYIFLSQPAETGAHEHRGRFYCRKQHGDRAFAVAIERSFR